VKGKKERWIYGVKKVLCSGSSVGESVGTFENEIADL
jgi:hypothetical protein